MSFLFLFNYYNGFDRRLSMLGWMSEGWSNQETRTVNRVMLELYDLSLDVSRNRYHIWNLQ